MQILQKNNEPIFSKITNQQKTDDTLIKIEKTNYFTNLFETHYKHLFDTLNILLLHPKKKKPTLPEH